MTSLASDSSIPTPLSTALPDDGEPRFTRQDYMAKRCTHEQFYGQFVTPGVHRLVRSFIGEASILRSTDPDFNDIPLQLWDRMHPLITDIVKSERGSVARHADPIPDQPRSFSWSLSNSVCVAKEAARQIKVHALEAQALTDTGTTEAPASDVQRRAGL